MTKYHYVYILNSKTEPNRHYIGHTSNLSERLKKHNEGGCPHTSKYIPWKLETAISFHSKPKTIAFEKYLKSGSGRTFARRHF